MECSEPFNSEFICRPWLLPVELFKTPEGFYIFDANYVKFLEVNELIFKIISHLKRSTRDIDELLELLPGFSPQEIRDALDEIKEIQDQGFFQLKNFRRTEPHDLSTIKKHLNDNLNGLYLNITSKCNLACSYCIFGGEYDQHGGLQQQEMTWDTARKAIEFFLPRARKKGHLRVDFFGGEPLLAFSLMERIVASIKERIRDRNQELIISVSSNGTVLSEKILDFLIDHDVHIQISIDGEKELQDMKRKFKTGKTGSFDTIMKNLQMIFERNPVYYKKKVTLKAVITTESLNIPGDDFLRIPLIETLKASGGLSVLNKSPHYNLSKDADFFDRLHRLGKLLLEKRDAATIDELIDGLSYKKKYLFYKTFFDFFQLQVVNYVYFGEDKPVPYTKNCMVGIEGCVNVDGSISICYKSDSFIIGNVIEGGWDFEKIDEYNKKRFSRWFGCEYCFVQRFCKLCFEKLDGKPGQFVTSIRNYCKFTRAYYRVIFSYMLKILEKNPALWDELQKQAERENEVFKQNEQANQASQFVSS